MMLFHILMSVSDHELMLDNFLLTASVFSLQGFLGPHLKDLIRICYELEDQNTQFKVGFSIEKKVG